jgi:uracil-DNA glycosylase
MQNTYNYDSWKERFPKGKVKLAELIQNSYWDIVFGREEFPSLIANINKSISSDINCSKPYEIYPPPDLVFRALDKSPEDTSTIIVGQDPYHGTNMVNGQLIPQATGYCFSVPRGAKIPSSLRNIYTNGLKDGSIWKKPLNGDLRIWSYQGCAMLNTALTVRAGSANSHSLIWKEFTNAIFSHISENMPPGVIVLWGKNALDKMPFLNVDRHTIVASSHPSGLSAYKGVTYKTKSKETINYPSFVNLNQFKTINNALIAQDRLPICWQPI